MNDLTALAAVSILTKSNDKITPIEKAAHIRSRKIYKAQGHDVNKEKRISGKRSFQFTFSLFLIIFFL